VSALRKTDGRETTWVDNTAWVTLRRKRTGDGTSQTIRLGGTRANKRTQYREHGAVLGGDQLGRVKGSQQNEKKDGGVTATGHRIADLFRTRLKYDKKKNKEWRRVIGADV